MSHASLDAKPAGHIRMFTDFLVWSEYTNYNNQIKKNDILCKRKPRHKASQSTQSNASYTFELRIHNGLFAKNIQQCLYQSAFYHMIVIFGRGRPEVLGDACMLSFGSVWNNVFWQTMAFAPCTKDKLRCRRWLSQHCLQWLVLRHVSGRL